MCTTEEDACPMHPDATTVISAEKLGIADPLDLDDITERMREHLRSGAPKETVLLLVTNQDAVILLAPRIFSEREKEIKFGRIYPGLIGKMRRFFMDQSGGEMDVKSVVFISEGKVTMVAAEESEFEENQDVVLIAAVNADGSRLRVLDAELNELDPKADEERCAILEPIRMALRDRITVAAGPSMYA